MSFIQFESGTEKEKARNELREARTELLKRAEEKFQFRKAQEVHKKFRGDDQWMLPSVSKKIDSMSEKSTKSKSKKSKNEKSSKSKKSKKKSKNKKHKKKKYSSSSSNSDSESNASDSSSIDSEIIKSQKRKRRNYSSDSSQDGWVEKEALAPAKTDSPLVRDDWMSGMLIPTFSKSDKIQSNEERKCIDSYDPTKNSRELNPFWKNGGTGLPTFMKPNSDSEDENNSRKKSLSLGKSNTLNRSGNWRKKKEENTEENYKLEKRRSSPRTKDSKQGRSRSRSRSNHAERRRQTRSYSRSRSKESKYRRSRSKSRQKIVESSRVESKRQENDSRTDDRSSRLRKSRSRSRSDEIKTDHQLKEQQKVASRVDFLTDQQMNELGAKIIKAEIMGNDELAGSLKEKLEKAREYRNTQKVEPRQKTQSNSQPKKIEKETILLTTTNAKGMSRPVQSFASQNNDLWGGRKGRKAKKTETHLDGERIRYFADDDRIDIKRMFENEKFTSANDQDRQFADIAGKHKNPNDDLEDIFAEKIQKSISQNDQDAKERARAIQLNEEFRKTLESCDKCFDSRKMEKQLIVSMGTNVYLTLPWHEPLLTGHCTIVPMQHVTCSTQLDEDVWSEITQYQKALYNMFKSRSQEVIFFETVRYLHKRPHMAIHCVPNRDFELAPFYFKKAIQESEREWSVNKQLISLKEKNLRQSVPKGLPYFWVQFGIENGFAHIIEEQDRFPSNFAQEIIGGLLNLDARLWRRPRKEPNPIPKVKQFSDWWNPFEFS